MDKIIEKLEIYAKLDGTELGAASEYLCYLWNSYRDYVSDEFVVALKNEIKHKLDNFEKYSEIVEHTETRTETWEELEWR